MRLEHCRKNSNSKGDAVMSHKYINCPECPMCKPQPGKRDGVKWGICHNGGNMVYLEPRKIKRASGSGYIYKPISSCGMYEKGE